MLMGELIPGLESIIPFLLQLGMCFRNSELQQALGHISFSSVKTKFFHV